MQNKRDEADLWITQNGKHLRLKRANSTRFSIHHSESLKWAIQKKLQTKRTTYELLQILSASLMDKTSLKELFEKTESEEPIINEQPFLPGFGI